MKKYYLFLLAILSSIPFLNAQTVGLTQHGPESQDDGYVLFSPIASTNTYLIDKCGKQVKSWSSTHTAGLSVYILPDGTLLRAGNANNPIFTGGGTGGIVEKIDWDGNVIWSYLVSDATQCQHHDVRALPNGNILIIAWESKTQQQAIDNGRYPEQAPENLWSEKIIEVQPVGATGGNIVWEWHVWDHLVQDFDNTKSNYGSVADNPQLINLNYNAWGQSDWIHLNAIDYNPTLDQIVLSSFSFNEIWIIDHSTTTAQAASHTGGNSGKGGDLLYRLGNPSTYNRDNTGNILFNGQHNAHWIKEGLPFANQIIVHNNGNGRPGGNYSSVEIIDPPLMGYNYTHAYPNLPAASSWNYNAGNPNDYYAPFISGAEQLPNGNVLVCNGPAGVFFEVTPSGNTVWKYVNPVNAAGVIPQGQITSNTATFRCSYYPFDYIGFEGHNLVSGNTIENENTLSENCSLSLAIAENNYADAGLIVYPNPAKDILNVNLPHSMSHGTLNLINNMGQTVYATKMNTHAFSIDTNRFATGLYFLKVDTDGNQLVQKIIIE